MPGDEHPGLEALLAEYVDRLNDGERIERERILSEHPELGPELVEHLEGFVEWTVESDNNEPLGTLGDYTLRRQIGRGGMGVVYEAWQGSLDRQVALKVLPAGIAADNKAFMRFMREAKTAAQLSHQNVVSVYGMGVEQNTPYYSMELVEGETLAQILARIKDAEPETETPFGKKGELAFYSKLASAFADVADGLQHAHSKGVTHRDIKPSNLILDSDGRLRILDFGLARLEGQQSITLSGDFVGTPLYMSPEQARRKKIKVDHRTDAYSLGATMYEALCGRPPFCGKDHAETLSHIIERDPVEPRRVNPRVPKDLETIVLKCLRKDSGDRYGTAEALAQDLRRFVRRDPIEARASTIGERISRRLRRHLKMTIGAIVAVMVLVVFAGLVAERQQVQLEKDMAKYERGVREAAIKVSTGIVNSPNRRVRWGPLYGDLEELVLERQVGPIRAAVRQLSALCSALPGERDAHYHLARARRLLGDRKGALAELDELLERIDADFVPALALRARIRGDDMGRGEWVREARRATASVTGESWESHWLEAFLAAEAFDWAAADEAHSRLLEVTRNRSEPFIGARLEALMGRGNARLHLGDNRAIADFGAVCFEVPSSLEANVLLGHSFLIAGHRETANRVFEVLETKYSGDAGSLWVALLLAAYDEHSGALRWSHGVEDDSLRARLTAYLALRDRNRPLALESALSAYRSQPDSDVCRQLLLVALADRGKLPASDSVAPDVAALLSELHADSQPFQAFDDFADGSALDGSPVRWSCPDLKGSCEVRDGELFLWNTLRSSVNARFVSEDFIQGDVTVRTECRFSGLERETNEHAQLGVTVHESCLGGYAGVLTSSGKIRLRRWDLGGESETLDQGDLGSASSEVVLQLDVKGDIIEFRVGRSSEPMPQGPQLMARDTTYRVGRAGVVYARSPKSGVSRGRFRSVRIFRPGQR